MVDSTPEFMFNRKKVKYNDLTMLIDNHDDFNIALNKHKTLNIVVDIESILDIFRIEFYEKMLSGIKSQANDIVGEMFNFIGHYRRFFNSKKINTKFFVVYNSNVDKYKKNIEVRYGDMLAQKTYLNGFIPFLMNRFKAISPFLNDVYTIDGKDVEHTSIYNILAHEFPELYNVPVMLMSNNELYFEYSSKFKNAFVMTNSTTNANIYGRKQFFENIIVKNKYIIKDNTEKEISSDFIPLFLNLRGYNDLEAFTEKFKPRKALKYVYNQYVEDGFFKGYNRCSEVSKLNTELFTSQEIEMFKLRNPIVDIYDHSNTVNDGDKILITNQYIQDTPDMKVFSLMNQRHLNNRVIVSNL